MRRGFFSGLAGVCLLAIAALPSRLGGRWSVVRALGGVTLDLSAVVLVVVPLVAVVALLLGRKDRWQKMAGPLAALPFGFGLWALTVTAQEVKSERGSFPTMFDLAEGTSNASILGASLGFLTYQRVWLPALIGTGLVAVVLIAIVRRKKSDPQPWRQWAGGLLLGLLAASLGVVALSAALQKSSNVFSPAALGDPLTGLVESTVDMMRHRGPATPRQLVIDAELPAGSAQVGATLLGWPQREAPASADGGCWPHPHARPLDAEREPMTADPRGRKLVQAFEQVSQALFEGDDGKVAVFQLSLEGFRADDLHALNPLAPRDLAPFVSGLYDLPGHGGDGVITSKLMFQAGVRTAHCLGAMTCGVGTLPYNLSIIRDLHPFHVRCASDVLGAAGFHHSFFYGSDAKFDGMSEFLSEHAYAEVISQAELPKDLPRGTWDGLVDFALFDQATAHVAAALAVPDAAPQFSLVMSLSNHSPFTAPQDMPPAVAARVDQAIKANVNRADTDDRLRLMTYSYTDAAVERLFADLERQHIDDRSIVVMMADHSTGHAYVWGEVPTETDLQKSQIPFAIVVPKAFMNRVKSRAALEAAMASVTALLDAAPLSQNDVPTLLLALLSAHPRLKALPEEQRWHSLGGQITSPWFRPGGEGNSYILGINGVSELFALDRSGLKVGNYEDSVFLKTRADRYRVTPRLIPITATLTEVMQHPDQCSEPIRARP